MAKGEIARGRLVDGRWRVITALDNPLMPAYRVRDDEGQDAELLILPNEDFVSSAKKFRSLNHENIITTYETGVWEGRAYLVRELVTGQSIRNWLQRDKRLGYDQALGIACQLCLASTAASNAGLSRLGFEPENILVTANGFAKVDPMKLIPVENPNDYMTPEELKRDEPTQKSDLFRIGLMIHEMLLGRLPDRDGYWGVRFEPLSTHDQSLSLELDKTISKALSLDPLERHRDSEALLDDLHPLLMTRPRPASAGPVQWYEDRRFWLYVAIALGALAFVLSLLTGVLPFPFGG